MPAPHECSVCDSLFELRFAYQVQRTPEVVYYFCSQKCHEAHLFAEQQKSCHVCETRFDLRFAYQQAQVDGETHYYCSARCRAGEMHTVEQRRQGDAPHRRAEPEGWDRQDNDQRKPGRGLG